MATRISFCTFNRDVSALWKRLYADWKGSSKLLLAKCSRSWPATTFSINYAWALSSNHNAKQFILIRCKHSQRAARSFVRGLENRLKGRFPLTSALPARHCFWRPSRPRKQIFKARAGKATAMENGLNTALKWHGTQVTCLQKPLCFKSTAMFEVLPDVSYTQRTLLKRRTGNNDE
jgi:hypothetical protein